MKKAIILVAKCSKNLQSLTEHHSTQKNSMIFDLLTLKNTILLKSSPIPSSVFNIFLQCRKQTAFL